MFATLLWYKAVAADAAHSLARAFGTPHTAVAPFQTNHQKHIYQVRRDTK